MKTFGEVDCHLKYGEIDFTIGSGKSVLGLYLQRGQVVRNRSQKIFGWEMKMNTLRLIACIFLLIILLGVSSVAAFAQAATFTATPSPVPPGQTVTFAGKL